MARVLLINPNYYDPVFSGAVVRAAINRGTPPLGLVTVAAPLVESGHNVKIFDMNALNASYKKLENVLRVFAPDVVGITATTPLIKLAYCIAQKAKETVKNVYVVVGGPHATALPEDVVQKSEIDCVVKGEGDITFLQIVEHGSDGVDGIIYKNERGVHECTGDRKNVENLDSLPFPAYHLVEIERYTQPSLSSRRSPLGYMETSRGCYGKCIYCNKNINGMKLRFKTPKRVVDEMEYMLKLGFRELHIVDDLFTADMDRATRICEEILRRKLCFPWYPRGGIRVDKINLELLKLMKRAGCYRIPFGVESGSQRILDEIKKGIKLEQAESAIFNAKAADLETECYFMIGLPTETEQDIQQSLSFAIKLNPDYVKFTFTIPLPGTLMFDRMMDNGQIKTTDWNMYNFSTSPRDIYEHDVLSWNVLERYSKELHRRYYFRTRYIYDALRRSVKNRSLLGHIAGFIKTRW